jgi:hypothetical protein
MKTQLFRTIASVGFVVAALMSTAAFADSGIHGRVTGRNEDGGFAGAVPAAKIEILSESGASVATSEANAHGYYKINLPPGRYYYKVTAEGYRDEDEGRGLKIDRTEGMLLFHFSLTKGENKTDRVKPILPERTTGELYGRVMEHTDDGDVGIPNAQITFVHQESREVAEVIVSSRKNQDNEVGSYRIVLAAGEWRASVRAKGFERFVEPESIQIADGTETKHDFILRKYEPSPEDLAAQGIRGTVMIEKGGKTSPPPFGVQVHVIRASDRSIVEQTEIAIHQGDFEFNLPAGTYRLVASAPDTEFAKAVSTPVFVFPRRFSTTRLVMRMKPEEAEPGAQPDLSDMPAIEITALNRRNKQPLFNAEIMLRQITDQSATVHRSLTNEKGIATFQVPEGQYFAVARLSGFEVVAASPPDDFARGRLLLDALPKQIAKGTFIMDFHREPTQTQSGAIVEVYDGKMGTPLTGATVSLSRGAATPIVQTTNDLGIASFFDATAGSYGLHVSLDGYYDVRREILHDPLKPHPRVAMYTRPTDVPAGTDGLFTVSGTVIFEPEVGFGTALIDGAQLRWTGPSTVTTTSGPVGAYSVTIPPGTYSVDVTPPAGSDFAPRTFPGISIMHDETRNFALLRTTTIPPLSPQVRINVVDSVTRRPIENAQVDLQLRGSGGADRVSGTTSSSGQLRLSVSAPGEYLAVASATGYESQRKEVTLREGIVSVLNMDLRPLDDSTTVKMVDISGWVVTPKAAGRSGRLSGRDLTLLPASSIPDWTHYDPIPNAAVLWQFPAEGGLPGAMRLARADRKGRFTMANLPQQVYTVTVEASGFESLRGRIEVRKGMSDLWLMLNHLTQHHLTQHHLTQHHLTQRHHLKSTG